MNRPQLGNQLISAANRLKELRELLAGLNAAGQHQFTGADYTIFESHFGLSAGQGANVLSLIALLDTILNSNATVTGVDRLSQLNEFQARLAGQ